MTPQRDAVDLHVRTRALPSRTSSLQSPWSSWSIAQAAGRNV